MESIASALLPPGPWFQTENAWQWLFVVVNVAPLAVGLAAARRRGLERLTGMPPWAGAAVWLACWALVVAFLGFMWDVTWHADLGRDQELFTVPHVLILIGLTGIGAAFVAAVALASRAREAPGLRIGPLRVPLSAIPLGLLAGGALAGFPLDDYWHAVYGIDVTMWSPTHLLMIGAASLTPIAVWLMLREAGVHDKGGYIRRLRLLMPAVVLVGLSTFQLEFDLGILQWQPLYQPLLIAAAMAIALTAARVAIGRGGALLAAAGFIVMRALVAVILTVGLGRGLPHFPLTVAEALCVEAAFLLPGLSTTARAIAGGLLIATAGLAAEWGWTHLWYALPWWGPGLLPYWWMDAAVAVAGALVGAAMGSVAAGRRASLPAPAAAATLAVIGVLLALHLPLRHAEPATVTLTAVPAGPAQLQTTREGVAVPEQPVWLRLTVSPATAPDGADWFGLVAWQGGAPVQHAALVREAPGTYRSVAPVPAGGGWKTLVMLYKGDVLEAAPVAMPPDLSYRLPQVATPLAPRTTDIVPASRLLTREAHGGPWWPAAAILAFFGLMAVVWTIALAAAFAGVSAASGPRPPEAGGRRRRAVIVGSARGVPMSLEGRVVLVTGAARGIGAALSVRLAGRGANVALAGLESEELRRVERACGAGASSWEVDVTDWDGLRRTAAGVVDRYGAIDVVVANAGIASAGFIRSIDPAAFERVVDVDLLGVWRTVRTFLPHLVESRGYCLVMSSMAAAVHLPGMAPYSVAKAGVEAFANTLRAEVRHLGVGVGVAHPSWIATDMVAGADEHPVFGPVRRRMPAVSRTYPVSLAAARLEAGIARRARTIHIPRWMLAVELARALLPPLVERAASRMVPEADAAALEDVRRRGEAASAPVSPGGAAAVRR